MNPIDLNKIMKTKENERSKTFSSKVIHTQTTTLFMRCHPHVMMHTLCKGDLPLLHDLAVQEMYTGMTMDSKSIAVVVRNLDAAPIMLRKKNAVDRVMALLLIWNTQFQ